MTTAARPPQYDISLDTLERQGSLRDYQRADAALVRTIEAQQHALMCGWGTPPQCFSFAIGYNYATSSTFDMLLRVPPFCTKFRVAILATGNYDYRIQVGGLQRVIFEGNSSLDFAGPRWQDGGAMPSIGNDTGFLEVLATQQATWQTVGARLTVDNPGFGALFSLAFYPLLEQAV